MLFSGLILVVSLRGGGGGGGGRGGRVAPKGLYFLNVWMKADIDSGYFGLKLAIFSLLLISRV